MRSVAPVLAALLALLMTPAAVAIDSVDADVPEVWVRVEGQRVDVDSTKVASSAPIGVAGGVETQDVDIGLDGPECRIATKLDAKEDRTKSCREAEVAAPEADPTLVGYDLGLRFGSIENAPIPANEDVAAESALVQSAGQAPPALLAAAAAGASLLGIYAAWRVLKWTGLAALIPLYSHISDDEILDDPNRAGIYRLIQGEPGISTKDIADRLDLAWGTVTHHLAKLEKRRFVVSKKYGKYRRYFANGEGGTEKKDEVAVLRLDRTGDVAALIRANPGMTQKAVSNALGVSSSTILWHVKRLEEVHLVTKVREGKLVRYYPAESLDAVLVAPPTPSTAA